MAGQEWPFVGREEEHAAAAARLTSTDYRGVFIAGAAGVGKTRLAQELLRDAPSAPRIVATAGTAAIPFAACAHLLPANLDVSTDPLVMWRRLTQGIAGDASPIVAVDDAHWLDPATAGWVHHLAVTGQARLIVTARSGEVTAESTTALWKDRLLSRVELLPFDEATVWRVLEEVLGAPVEPRTAQRMAERSGGSILYLRELVDGAQAQDRLVMRDGAWVELAPSDVTPRLIELLAQRLGRLADDEREALAVVALGEPLPVQALDRLVDGQLAAKLERDGLIHTTWRDARLAHPLYGEALVEALGDRDRRRLLGRLVDAFEEGHDGDVVTRLRLASWRVDAGLALPVPVALDVGDTALRVGFLAPAERFARAALDAGAGAPGALRLGEALLFQDRIAEANATLTGVVMEDLDVPERPRWAMAAASARCALPERLPEAVAILERAIASSANRVDRDLLRAHLALMVSEAGQMAEGGRLALELLSDEALDGAAAMKALVAAGSALSMAGRPLDAIALCDRLAGVPFSREELQPTAGLLMSQRLSALILAGQTDEADVLTTMLEQLVQTMPLDTNVVAGTLMVRGILLLDSGQLRDALRAVQRAAALARVSDFRGYLSWCLAMAAYAHAQLGEVAPAAEAVAEGWATLRWDHRVHESELCFAQAWVDVLEGRQTEGLATLLGHADEFGRRGHLLMEASLVYQAVRLGASATVHAARLEQLAADDQGDRARLWALHVAGLAADNGGILTEAAEGLLAARTPILAAEAFAGAAAAFDREGLRARATQAAQRAAAVAETCDGVLTPLMRQTGERTALTPRELEVATQAARGASTREIATALELSPRTVETHLQHTYTKLGVTSRNELGRILLAPHPGRTGSHQRG